MTDPELTEFQPLIQNLLSVLGPMIANGPAPELIGEVV